MKLPRQVTIREVGTRDGFQIEPEFIPTEQKIEVVNRLAEAGLPRIEVTSFVSPKAIPQLRDAAEVMAAIARRAGTTYSALVPNDKGAVRAVDARVDEIHTVVSASESHNLANVNMTIAESLGKLAAVAEVARRAGVPVGSGLSGSFGCPSSTWAPAASGSPPPPAWPTPRRSAACWSGWCRASPAWSGRCTPMTRARWPSPISWPRWSTG